MVPGGKSSFRPERLYFSNNFEVFIAILSALGLLGIGFLISVVSEGYIFTKLFPKGQRFLKTVLKMNLFSYLALILILSPNILKVIQEKSWWFYEPKMYTANGNLKKGESIVFHETVTGEWKSVVNSIVSALKGLGYEVERVGPDDKFQKWFKEIETKYSSLDEAKRRGNFPTSIQLNIKRENEQTSNIKIEIILKKYNMDDSYFPDLTKHENSGCLSGPIKDALLKAFIENNIPQDALKCVSGR